MKCSLSTPRSRSQLESIPGSSTRGQDQLYMLDGGLSYHGATALGCGYCTNKAEL